MRTKIFLILNTVRYLKLIQIRYQLWYRLKRALRIMDSGKVEYKSSIRFPFINYIYNRDSFLESNHFVFLNKSIDFGEQINWNVQEHGKLWTYNLSYFDFLNQSSQALESKKKLLYSFIDDYESILDGKESYPTSLRIINTIKFVLSNNIEEQQIDLLIAKDAYRLGKNLEYHLLANHLLENAFALFFAGFYLQNTALYEKGKTLVLEQLKEQILEDGAHYELSPMYHQLMLYRVLDSVQISSNDLVFNNALKSIAGRMLSWLNNMTFSNGDIPLVNDSANGINPTSAELYNYADELNVTTESVPLNESGYRMLCGSNYELMVDIGDVKPSYQPGHTHADTFNFVLYVDGSPFIIDMGTSTYDIGNRRSLERSTEAHNTVIVNNRNSSQVWSGFRVAKRARVTVEEDSENKVVADHNGYAVVHARKWEVYGRNIDIYDTLSPSEKGIGYLHLHPEVKVHEINKNSVRTSLGVILFEHVDSIELQDYSFAQEFNQLVPAKRLAVTFNGNLKTKIKL